MNFLQKFIRFSIALLTTFAALGTSILLYYFIFHRTDHRIKHDAKKFFKTETKLIRKLTKRVKTMVFLTWRLITEEERLDVCRNDKLWENPLSRFKLVAITVYTRTKSFVKGIIKPFYFLVLAFAKLISSLLYAGKETIVRIYFHLTSFLLGVLTTSLITTFKFYRTMSIIVHFITDNVGDMLCYISTKSIK